MDGFNPMKVKIAMSKKSRYTLIGVFCTLILFASFFFSRNWINWQEELKYFKTIKINSGILELKELNRGNCQVKLNVKETVIEFNLPISFEVKRDHIQAGDSLSKNENSGVCEIYRLDQDGKAQKVSEWIIK